MAQVNRLKGFRLKVERSKGSGTICRNDPQGAARKWFLTPCSLLLVAAVLISSVTTSASAPPSIADDAMAQGSQAFQRGSYEDALGKLKKAARQYVARPGPSTEPGPCRRSPSGGITRPDQTGASIARTCLDPCAEGAGCSVAGNGLGATGPYLSDGATAGCCLDTFDAGP